MGIDMVQWIKDHLDIRPFNASGKKDGNFNYIHQQHVLNLFFKLRNQNVVLTNAMHSDGEGRCEEPYDALKEAVRKSDPFAV